MIAFIFEMQFQQHPTLCQCEHCKARHAAAEQARAYEDYEPREEEGVIVRGPGS